MSRFLLRLLLGARRPIVRGEVRVPGLTQPVTIRRDAFGIPTVQAETVPDGYFGLGFAQGQDRGFQLESLLRVVRGTLAELVGPAGLPIDRVSRRIGFRRASDVQFPILDADIRDALSAFVNGLNSGRTVGSSKPPHEFSLLGARPTPWEPADVLGVMKLQTFLLPANWDVELARLRILDADGPGALRAVDPAGVAALTPGAQPIETGPLERDLAAFQQFLPAGGGSNNWVIAGSRTSTGKPILANDPHLGPSLPNPWYLAHLDTPDWKVAGATLVGGPVFPIAHNGFACWGVTAGLTDNTDWVIVNPDAPSTGRIERRRETIQVKNAADEPLDVAVTDHGPIVTEVNGRSLALRAVWLEPLPIRGFFDAPKAESFDQFCRPFAHWPGMPLNVVYADTTGTTGYQLIGQLPRRSAGDGTLPLPPQANVWDGLIPFDQMPRVCDPTAGFHATANDPNGIGGVDFVEVYRATAIRESLAAQTAWTVEACGELQRDQNSLPWRQLRPIVLARRPTDADAALGFDLLESWDGHVSADSPAAAVYELLVAEVCVQLAQKLAPNAWLVALGGGLDLGPFTASLFSGRRTGHLVRVLTADPTAVDLTDALGRVVRRLRSEHGPGPRFWQWGDLRMLKLSHSLFAKHWLGRVFNLGPVPFGGDGNTICQAAVSPLDPLDFASTIPNLRAVFDTADWSNSRFVLAGGQSGNPCSPHFDDQFPLWLRGDTVRIAWSADEVIRTAVSSLRLSPMG